MIKKLKDKLKWAFTTKMGLTVSSVCWILLWAIIYRITDAEWTYNTMTVGIFSLLGMVLLMIVHAWIINPIRAFRNKRKNKE